MDPKEIKTCLKMARESIRSKDFKEALKQCKVVLAVDKSNYNALVFVGVAAEAMEQPDQALKAYKRATEISPEQLLAWQGLGNMLDKNKELLTVKESVDVFSKLVELNNNDISKELPHLSKLADLYIQMNDTVKAVEIICRLMKIDSEDKSKKKWNKLLIAQLSSKVLTLSEEKLQLYESALRGVLDGSSMLSRDEVDDYTEKFIAYLSQKKTIELKESVDDLIKRFPDAYPLIEVLLQYYLERSIDDKCWSMELDEKIRKLTSELEILKSGSVILKVGLAYIFLKDEKLIQARDILKDVGDLSISGLYYSCKVHQKLHSLEKCINICEEGVAACSSGKVVIQTLVSDVISHFQLIQASAYRRIGSPEAQEKAQKLLDKVEGSFPHEANTVRAFLKLDQGDLEGAEKCAARFPDDDKSSGIIQALILAKKGQESTALIMLQEAVDEDPMNAEATLQLGKLLWEVKNSESMQKCFTILLKAAKLDPYNYESFLYIGHFYKDVQGDNLKAKRCYQKAYDLSGGKDEAGASLVDTLTDLGEESQSIKVLESATIKAAAGCAKWAWLRLGLHQIKQEEPTTAIASLQSALRADPDDNHVWECLADAYYQRGSYTAALKAFTKASELDPDSIYCVYQIASIKQTLGSLSEAIQEYKQILFKSPNYVPVLKGLAESLIQLAKHNISKCLDGLAQDFSEEALVYLTRAASHRPDLSCLWKLMGEACILVQPLAKDEYRVPVKLIEKSSDSSSQIINKQQLMEIGAKCYSQAVKLLPDQGFLWHDLAACLYCISQLQLSSERKGETGGSSTGGTVLQRAMRAVKKALSLEPKDWAHWNLLGVIACCKDYENLALAQHCFIKSVECENTNPVAWSNLGALYLGQGNIQLAHDAFKCAQNVDPNYVACWVGQALIAEVVGHEEAMDLFRHTTELGVHLESCVGYGQWVLSFLGDQTKRDTELFKYCIMQMAAVPAASDALLRYTRRVENDPVAYNMLGLLLEHQKLFQSATEAFKTAFSLFQNQGDNSRMNDVRFNLARTLCSQGKYDLAIKEYSDSEISQTEHLCCYGLALFYSNKLVEAFEVLEAALQQADSDKVRSQLHAALGMAAYKFNDIEGAKTQLFSSFQMSEPSGNGLLALCALGLLEEDLTLASAALDELDKLPDKGEYLSHIARLGLYRKILKKQNSGESYMREMVETYPEEAGLWLLLAQYIISAMPDLGAAAVECCQTSESLDANVYSLKRLLIQSRCQLLAGHHKRLDPKMNALKSAQRALFINPASNSALCSLTAAVHAEAVVRLALEGDSGLLQVEHGLLRLLAEKDIPSDLKMWCLQLSIVNRILCDNIDFEEIQSQIEMLSPSNSLLENAINSDADLSGEISESRCIHIALALIKLSSQGQYEEAAAFLSHILKERESDISPFFFKYLLERYAYICYKGLQESGSEILKENFDSIVQLIKDKNISSSIINALMAVRVVDDNKRQAKHHFATALDQVDTTDLGYTGSLCRQGLVTLLWESLKESDQQLIEALLKDGQENKDHALSKLMRTLKGK